MNIRGLFETSPIITAVKNEKGLNHATEADSTVVLILYGTILNIQKTADRIKNHGKPAIVHMDLIAGSSPREVVIDFIKGDTSADGTISTKPVLVRYAIRPSLIGGQRTFLTGSMALDNIKKQLESLRPDFMELIPGIMPGVLYTIRQTTDVPLVVGDLLSDKKDTMAAFDVGVSAVSAAEEQL